MNDVHLVTVLLPLYNEPVEIAKESILSICNQTYRELEILLILDNPKNGDLKGLIQTIAENDSRIKSVINSENIGLPQTLNKGIDLAHGAYIARMDADDIALPERIQKQVGFLERHPAIGLLGCDAYIIDDDDKVVGFYSKLKSNWTNRIFLKHCGANLIHPTWIAPAKTFKQCRYRNYLSAQDYDFALRASAMGIRFCNLKEPLLKYRIPKQTLRTISCKRAYEQYVNTMIARKQYRDFLSKGVYPTFLDMIYDEADKERFLSTIPLLNQLREYVFLNKYRMALKTIITILKIDPRPITFRIKSWFFKTTLSCIEKLYS